MATITTTPDPMRHSIERTTTIVGAAGVRRDRGFRSQAINLAASRCWPRSSTPRRANRESKPVRSASGHHPRHASCSRASALAITGITGELLSGYGYWPTGICMLTIDVTDATDIGIRGRRISVIGGQRLCIGSSRSRWCSGRGAKERADMTLEPGSRAASDSGFPCMSSSVASKIC
jgi:hypothetical protein